MLDELHQLRLEVSKLRAERDLFERLYQQERSLVIELQRQHLSERHTQVKLVDQSDLLAKLGLLTVKQRASLLALVAGHSYGAVAHVMGVNVATVKLHCKSAFALFDCEGLQHFKAKRSVFLHVFTGLDLEELCGVPLDWMTTRPAALMTQLRRVRTSAPPPGGGVRNAKIRAGEPLVD